MHLTLYTLLHYRLQALRVRHPRIIWLCLASLMPFSTTATAEKKPQWEMGVGLGYVTFPDYRGSDESKDIFAPIPYFIYRGDVLQADRGGMRGILYRSDRVTIKVSINATIPVDSENNRARQGMPDLKSTFQVGPSFELALWESEDRRTQVDLKMPVRLPFTIESDPQGVGWVYLPRLTLNVSDAFGQQGLEVGLGVGPTYANKTYHNYFYSVDERFATPDRPVYRASSGPSGNQWFVGAAKRYDRFWIGAFARYDTLSDAVFRDSPLVTRQSSFTGAIGFAWIFAQSNTLVTVMDSELP